MDFENDLTKISVVIPCRNSEATIQRALSSVCSQTIKPQELIVIDDASSDKTSELLNVFSNQDHDFPIIVLKNDFNLGPGLSRNKGWDHARGAWISFLDSDDAWLENKLENQIEFSSKIKSLDVISFSSTLFSGGYEFFDYSVGIIGKLQFQKMLFRNQIVTRTVAIRRSISNRFPSGLSEDYGLWLELLAEGFNIYKVDKVTALTFRPEYSKGGVSSQLIKQEFFEIKRLGTYLRKSPILVSLAILFSVVKFMRRVCITSIRSIHR
jgi:glycosyltransferase involved in cell wall biosynthesis